MAEARVDRRLAAILAADVSGYSRLIGVDEEGTLAALKACRRPNGLWVLPGEKSDPGGSRARGFQSHAMEIGLDTLTP